MYVCTKIGSHHRLQSAYLSHRDTPQLYIALYNWNLGTQDLKNRTFLMYGRFWSEIFTKDDTHHLLDSLKNHYAVSTYCEGCNYLGLIIYWKLIKEYVDISKT